MKHSNKIVLILLGLFVLTQLLGLAVISFYSPFETEVTDLQGNLVNTTSYNLPYGFNPPPEATPSSSLISIIVALIIAIFLMFFFMKFKLELLLRLWFFFVVFIAIGITLTAAIAGLTPLESSSIIALVIALPLAYLKIFQRNVIAHNFTELLIYPGIAAIFVPWFNILTIVILLIIISVYDIWAVWHVGVMQKMANYQIKKLRLFAGFFLPYLGPKQREKVKALKAKHKAKSKNFLEKKLKETKMKINVAILGGGDVVWPMILAGAVLNSLGLLSALVVILGATLGLAYLFLTGEKAKPYPAMPYITTGCLIALAIIYLFLV